jgi:hypothetical protein
MKAIALGALCTALAAGVCVGGSRTGGVYSVNDAVSAAGGRTASANALYKNDASIGGIGGISTATSPNETMKHGYIGQLYEVVGVVLGASPASVNEGQTRQLAASAMLDDLTTFAVAGDRVSWSILDGPIASISLSGLATAGVVYQSTNANVQGTHQGFSSSLMLSVLNVGLDDYGSYAGDGIDDDWQVLYFGENSPNAAPGADPDRDGQTNKFEFVAGVVPNDASSRFQLRIVKVAGQPSQRQLIFSPRLDGRTYSPRFRSNLSLDGEWFPLSGATSADNGAERIITDLNATGPAKFYRIDISKP